MNTLNERIKEARKALSLSQKEFTEKVGISQRAISWGEQPGNNVPAIALLSADERASMMTFRIMAMDPADMTDEELVIYEKELRRQAIREKEAKENAQASPGDTWR